MGIEFLVIPMVFSIPIIAILSATFMKYQKLRHESGALSRADKEKVRRILEENEQLRNRVENLEMIMSDPDSQKLNTLQEKGLQKQIDDLSQEIRSLRQMN